MSSLERWKSGWVSFCDSAFFLFVGAIWKELIISYYYNCSCTLLYKPQEETDPLGDVPNDSSRNSDKDELASKAEEHGSSVMPYNSKTTNLEDGPIFLFYRSSFNDFKVEGGFRLP